MKEGNTLQAHLMAGVLIVIADLPQPGHLESPAWRGSLQALRRGQSCSAQAPWPSSCPSLRAGSEDGGYDTESPGHGLCQPQAVNTFSLALPREDQR